MKDGTHLAEICGKAPDDTQPDGIHTDPDPLAAGQNRYAEGSDAASIQVRVRGSPVNHPPRGGRWGQVTRRADTTAS